jgi:hypothetical protein
MREDMVRMRALLAEATATIALEYFLLPVAAAEGGRPLDRYRERVYAYELYHQLRAHWPHDWPYSLGGEIDKAGHPVIRGGYLDGAKPDLLVHVPGTMDRNLLVMEIKTLRPRNNPAEQHLMTRDFQKLVAFREVGYFAAAFLVFGDDVDRVRNYGRESGIDLALIELWHHRRPGEQAALIDW